MTSLMEPPRDRRYSPDHVWIDEEGYVGVTHHLASALGPIDRVHLPEAGATLRAAEAFGALEGAKGIVDLYAPCDARAIAINELLSRDPEVIRRRSYGDGWLLRVSPEATVALWDAATYAARCGHGYRARRMSSPPRKPGESDE